MEHSVRNTGIQLYAVVPLAKPGTHGLKVASALQFERASPLPAVRRAYR